MTQELRIERGSAEGMAAVEALYPDAFPDEDLLPLVIELLQDQDNTLSLFARSGPATIGHIAFTQCHVEGCAAKFALLGPLAIASASQKMGVGSALIRDGLRRMEEQGVTRVFVLGDPGYYGRFGFACEADVAPPYAIPADWKPAWQSISLGKNIATCRGVLAVPLTWQSAALWAP